MEDNNVIRMDEHKNKNKVHKISFKKILLGFIVCIPLSILVIAGTCKTKKIKIELLYTSGSKKSDRRKWIY